MNRITTLLVSAALTAPVALGLAAPAQAAPSELGSRASAAPTAKATLTTRTITISADNKGKTAWVFGKVSGTYKNKTVIIKKRKCGSNGCKMVSYKTVKTNSKSKYKAYVAVPNKGKVVYQARVKASGGFEASLSPKIKLYWI
ncbi:hypothetical protein [Nocardioides sp.]|uniref:hypothetical protein n=1 Tax=Nocardioides sp. TaxID=35761 RepID=UPI0035297308